MADERPVDEHEREGLVRVERYTIGSWGGAAWLSQNRHRVSACVPYATRYQVSTGAVNSAPNGGTVIVNLTPHLLAIHTPEGVREIPPSGAVARVATTTVAGSPVDGIPVVVSTTGEVTGLPDPGEGTAYVVSLVVAQAAARKGRTDVYSPGELVRGPDGRPIGCRGLARPA